MQQATQQNSEKPKPTCHCCKKQGRYRKQCHQLKREKDQAQNNTNCADKNNKKNGKQANSNSNKKFSNNTNANNTNNPGKRRPRPIYLPCETCGKTNHSTEKYYVGANAANRPSTRKRTGRTQPSPTEKCPEEPRWKCSSCSPNFKLETPRFYSGAACDRPETTEILKLPPIPEVVWQQPSEISTNQSNFKLLLSLQ